MAQKNAISRNDSLEYDMEFVAADDSWYSVVLVLRDETLTAKYCSFPEDDIQVFHAKDLKSVDEIKAFSRRFRPASQQVQDSECSRILPGIAVCASYSFGNGELHYYDALVDQVENREHSFAKGEEECLCKFVLFWQHGPNAGNLTIQNIESICLIQPNAPSDSNLCSFLKMVQDRIQMPSCDSGSASVGDGSASNIDLCSELIINTNIKNMPSLGLGGFKDQYFVKQSLHTMWSSEDVDCGGSSYDYMIFVENLDKELSAPTIVEFIFNQTLITPRVNVFPALSSELYTRGTIVLDCKKEFEKLCVFLDNPNHIIVSSKGRPWLTTERILSPRTFGINTGTPLLKSQALLHNIGTKSRERLKVVYCGTEEYKTAKELKDLYKDLHDHLQRIYKRLVEEEQDILLLSHRV